MAARSRFLLPQPLWVVTGAIGAALVVENWAGLADGGELGGEGQLVKLELRVGMGGETKRGLSWDDDFRNFLRPESLLLSDIAGLLCGEIVCDG